jgi:hypothetical protein
MTLMTCGCHVPSKVALEGQGGRTAYNVSVQTTNAEEMLLNLVRIKYYDSPFFMEVGNITTQFTYKAATSQGFKIPGFTNNNPFSLGGEFSWQNQPTIQYSPLEGNAFATQLMQPIDLTTIQQIICTGWDVDKVFRLTVQSLDNLLNTPIVHNVLSEAKLKYESFFEAVNLMKYFQDKGSLQIGIKINKSKCNQENNEKILQIAFPADDEKSERLSKLLGGVETHKGKYILNMLQGFNDNGWVGIMTRSLLSCIYYLGKGVEAPAKDIEAKKVSNLKFTKEETGVDFSIKNCKSQPKNAYVSIKYRDSWFYIDDSDVETKKTFLLLLQLYTLQSTQKSIEPPLLTLPLG